MKIAPCRRCTHLVEKYPTEKHCGAYEFVYLIEGKFRKEDVPEMIEALQKFAAAREQKGDSPNK